MSALYKQFRTLFEQVVGERLGPDPSVAVLLSGGVDSLSCAFAAQSLGKRVVAYTFQVAEWRSSDSASAEAAAKKFGWQFVLVKVPLSNLEKDFVKLARDWKCAKKTQFECTWPFLYLVPAIRENVVLSGIAADGHYGLSKKAMIHARPSRAAFVEFRQKYFGSANPAGQIQQKALLEAFGKVQIAPYLDRRLYDFFIPYDWNELNRPYEKHIVLNAYREEFQRVSVRKHANLQLVSGVDHIFESLLKSTLNTKKRSRVMDLCRDYAVTQDTSDDD